MTFPMRVTFKKQVSDSNYGSETIEVALDAESTDDDVARGERVAELLELARQLVGDELNNSPSAAVRRGTVQQPSAQRAVDVVEAWPRA